MQWQILFLAPLLLSLSWLVLLSSLGLLCHLLLVTVNSLTLVILPKTGELKVDYVLPLPILSLLDLIIATVQTGKVKLFLLATFCGCGILVGTKMPLAPFF